MRVCLLVRAHARESVELEAACASHRVCEIVCGQERRYCSRPSQAQPSTNIQCTLKCTLSLTTAKKRSITKMLLFIEMFYHSLQIHM